MAKADDPIHNAFHLMRRLVSMPFLLSSVFCLLSVRLNRPFDTLRVKTGHCNSSYSKEPLLAMTRAVQMSQSETSPLLADDYAYSGYGITEGRIAATGASNAKGDEDHLELQLEENLSALQLIIILSGPWLGSFLGAMDSSIVATLSAPISASFDSLSLISWVGSAYLVATAAIQPISGRLSDIFSRRTSLIYANLFFAIGNLMCGLARTKWVLIFGRVVAGIGGGGLTAVSTFLGSDIIPLRRRGLWQGFGNVIYGDYE